MRKFVLVLLVISMIFSFGCSVAETPDNEQTEDNGGISGDMTNENPSDLHGDNNSSHFIDFTNYSVRFHFLFLRIIKK